MLTINPPKVVFLYFWCLQYVHQHGSYTFTPRKITDWCPHLLSYYKCIKSGIYHLYMTFITFNIPLMITLITCNINKGMSASEMLLCLPEVHSDKSLCMALWTKLKQLFYLISWSRITMMAEVSWWESTFLFFASMNCIPLGSVKKDFCVKLLLYSTPATIS